MAADCRRCVGGCFVCFERGESGPGRAGDRAWAAAAPAGAVSAIEGAAGAAYEAGLLALREGPLLEAAVRALAERPDVLLVNATGRDHPRRAGLALHLGIVLDLPTVGVTHRSLLAAGEWPRDERGAQAPLVREEELVGYWLRTKRGTCPLAVQRSLAYGSGDSSPDRAGRHRARSNAGTAPIRPPCSQGCACERAAGA